MLMLNNNKINICYALCLDSTCTLFNKIEEKKVNSKCLNEFDICDDTANNLTWNCLSQKRKLYRCIRKYDYIPIDCNYGGDYFSHARNSLDLDIIITILDILRFNMPRRYTMCTKRRLKPWAFPTWIPNYFINSEIEREKKKIEIDNNYIWSILLIGASSWGVSLFLCFFVCAGDMAWLKKKF